MPYHVTYKEQKQPIDQIEIRDTLGRTVTRFRGRQELCITGHSGQECWISKKDAREIVRHLNILVEELES